MEGGLFGSCVCCIRTIFSDSCLFTYVHRDTRTHLPIMIALIVVFSCKQDLTPAHLLVFVPRAALSHLK